MLAFMQNETRSNRVYQFSMLNHNFYFSRTLTLNKKYLLVKMRP